MIRQVFVVNLDIKNHDSRQKQQEWAPSANKISGKKFEIWAQIGTTVIRKLGKKKQI